MKAMILAAGLGTRLRPLTDSNPKALMPIVNSPIISRTIDYLKSFGVSDIAVNAHHHFDQIIEYLEREKSPDLKIDVRIENQILGTGGGIKNTQDFWDDEPFIVINCDILTDIDLGLAYEHHKRSGSIATMILHDYPSFNQVRIDEHQRIIEINQEPMQKNLAFTGIHIIEPDLLSYIPDTGYSNIIDLYRSLIYMQKPISAYISEGHYWRDIGNPDSYITANKEILGDRILSIGNDTKIAPSAKITDWNIIGKKCNLEQEVEITRSIIWDNVTVKKGIKITDCVITSSKEVTSDMKNEIL